MVYPNSVRWIDEVISLAASGLIGLAVSQVDGIVEYSSQAGAWHFAGGHNWVAVVGVWVLCYPMTRFALLLWRGRN